MITMTVQERTSKSSCSALHRSLAKRQSALQVLARLVFVCLACHPARSYRGFDLEQGKTPHHCITAMGSRALIKMSARRALFYDDTLRLLPLPELAPGARRRRPRQRLPSLCAGAGLPRGCCTCFLWQCAMLPVAITPLSDGDPRCTGLPCLGALTASDAR